MLREIQIVECLRMMPLPLGNPLVVAHVSALTGIGVCVHLGQSCQNTQALLVHVEWEALSWQTSSSDSCICFFVYLRLI